MWSRLRYNWGVSTQWSRSLALGRVGLAGAVGVLVALVAGFFHLWTLAAQLGWDAVALTYIGLTLPVVLRLDPDDTARKAGEEDPTWPVADLLLLGASVASLASVTVVLLRAAHSNGVAQVLLIVLSVVSVVVSWALVHVTYMLRYARLYYSDFAGSWAASTPLTSTPPATPTSRTWRSRSA